MKKNKHPKKLNTQIIFSNGSSYNKKWVFFKKHLKTEIDILKNKIWLKKN